LRAQFLQSGLPILIAIPFAERLGKYRKRKRREPIRSLHYDPMGTDSSECCMHTRCLQLKVVHFIVSLPEQQVASIVFFDYGRDRSRVRSEVVGLHRFARIPLKYRPCDTGDVAELTPRHLPNVAAATDIVK